MAVVDGVSAKQCNLLTTGMDQKWEIWKMQFVIPDLIRYSSEISIYRTFPRWKEGIVEAGIVSGG